MSRDFLTRGKEEEIHSRSPQHVMPRRSPWGIWPQFANTNVSTWDFAIYGKNRLHYPLRDNKIFAEWIPETFTLCEVCSAIGLPHARIDPYHYKIADQARGYGSPKFSGGRVDFAGPRVQTIEELK